MSRVAPRIGGFAASVSVVLLLSLVLNSWLGVFPAIISGVMPMKFHIHYYLGNLFGLEYASAYSESGVMTMQEHLQLIILPMALMAARMGLRQRPTFEMPSSPSLSEQAEAMEAGTVATVGQVDESGSFRILVSRLMLIGTFLLFVLNSMLGLLPGIIFNQQGMKIHPIYALSRLIGRDTNGPTWSEAAMLSAQEILMIWFMVFLIPTAFSMRPKPIKEEAPQSDLPPVGRSNERVINPLAAEVIASVLGDTRKVDSSAVESALGEMDNLIESEFNSAPSGVVADSDEGENHSEDESVELGPPEPVFILDSPKEEAKLHLDQDDVEAIAQGVEDDVIPDAATLLGIESEPEVETVSEEVEAEEALIPESIQSIPTPRSTNATISGEMSIRPTNLPATAELDPKTGRWMINGVPVGPKVTATGIDSESSSGRRIGGDDPLKESKKRAEDKEEPVRAERRGEKRGEKIVAEDATSPPRKRTKDGQKEHEPLPDMPEMTGRPNAERPKERKDDVELPDMPKF